MPWKFSFQRVVLAITLRGLLFAEEKGDTGEVL